MSIAVPIFSGTCDVAGRVHLHAKAAFTAYLSRLKNKPIEVVVREKRPTRSRNANAYWWGVCIPLIADSLGYQPHEHEAVHDAVVRQIAGLRPGSDPRLEIRASTHDMDKEDFGILIEQTIIWAATELGIAIPDQDSAEAKVA